MFALFSVTLGEMTKSLALCAVLAACSASVLELTPETFDATLAEVERHI